MVPPAVLGVHVTIKVHTDTWHVTSDVNCNVSKDAETIGALKVGENAAGGAILDWRRASSHWTFFKIFPFSTTTAVLCTLESISLNESFCLGTTSTNLFNIKWKSRARAAAPQLQQTKSLGHSFHLPDRSGLVWAETGPAFGAVETTLKQTAELSSCLSNQTKMGTFTSGITNGEMSA